MEEVLRVAGIADVDNGGAVEFIFARQGIE
jgi:hypothetical protein